MVEKTSDMENPLVNRQQVKKAVKTLVDLFKTSDKSGESKVKLIDAAKKIDLQFSVGKVYTARTKFSLDLPHSIDEESREVCLFVEDLDLKDREYEKTVVHFQDLFKKKGVGNRITKIIPIKALRTDYCQPHNRRTLAKAYDLFLADRKITGFLPALLGKIFYGRTKTVPRKVHLDVQNLKQHLDTVINSSMCEMGGRGFSSHVQVAHDQMTDDKIIDNTMKALDIIASRVPGGRNNIRSVHISSPNEKAIPLYFNHVDPSEMTLPEIKKDTCLTTEGEVTTVEDGFVRIRADGYVEVISNKRKVDDDQPTEDVEEKKPKLEVKDEIIEVKEEDESENEDKKRNTKKPKKDKKKVKELDKNQRDAVKRKSGKKNSKEIKDEDVVKEEQSDEVKVEEVQMVEKTNKKRKGDKANLENVEVQMVEKTNKKGKRKVSKVRLENDSKDTENKTEENVDIETLSKSNKKNKKRLKENKKGLKSFGDVEKDTNGEKDSETVDRSKDEMNRKNKKLEEKEVSKTKKRKIHISDLDIAVAEKVNEKGSMEKKRKNKKKK